MQSKNTTKRAAKQSPHTGTGTKTHARTPAPAPRETDYTLTSQKRVVSKKAAPAVEIRLKRFLSRHTLKAWRKEHGYSAHALAVELGVSRAYIKSIEGGSLPASQKLIARFDALREKLGAGSAAPAQDPDTARRVVSRYALPQSFEILARPVKCKTCNAFFIPRTPTQKYCGTRCAKLARRTAPKRTKTHRARSKPQ